MIRVPENWPMAWWSADASMIRMACPACGRFELYADRNGTPTLSCKSCGLAGAANVQRAIAAFLQSHADALAQEQADNDALMRAEEARLDADPRHRHLKQNRLKGMALK